MTFKVFTNVKMAGEVSSSVDDIDVEIERLLANKDSQNTKRATKTGLRVFHDCVRDTGEVEKDTKLRDECLAIFFASVEKKDGSMYKSTAFQWLRFGQECITKIN